MPPDKLLEALARAPFEPFRIHMTDGKVYDIRHPEMVLLDRRSAHVGVTREVNGKWQIYDRFAMIALIHVVRLEPIQETSTSEA